MSSTVLDNGCLAVTVVPASGARIARLRDRHGHDWIVGPQRPEPGYPPDVARDQVRFDEGTRSGWDECLPSVAAEPGSADHGELWFRPWTALEVSAHAATWSRALTRRDGGALRVIKSVRLLDRRAAVAVALRIENAGARDAALVYSAHPLFRWPSDASVQLPGATDVRSAFGRPSGTGRWPRCGQDELSTLPRAGAAENYKVFVRWTGRARLAFDGVPGTLVLDQPDTETTPWLGLCVNRDHWPQPQPGASWIALEPTSSPTDSRAQAVAQATALVIPARASRSWTTTVTIEDAA